MLVIRSIIIMHKSYVVKNLFAEISSLKFRVAWCDIVCTIIHVHSRFY